MTRARCLRTLVVSKLLKYFGGPDRDRTDDLFHAMEVPRWCFIDGKGLMSWLSRRNRPNRREMLPICYQLSIEQARADSWGISPILLSCSLPVGFALARRATVTIGSSWLTRSKNFSSVHFKLPNGGQRLHTAVPWQPPDVPSVRDGICDCVRKTPRLMNVIYAS